MTTSSIDKFFTNSQSKIYTPSKNECIEWFHILNENVFDQSLPDLTYIEVGRRRGVWGYYEYEYDEKQSMFKTCGIKLHNRYPDQRFFVEILAHELVHHHQAIYNDGRINHGPTFMSWSPKLRKKGIKLSRTYEK